MNSNTTEVADEIGEINAGLNKENRNYLLIGPGRWGSLDRWLGIPVRWQHISGARAIVELRNDQLKADPSQGSHFFQNITALGIPYITVTENSEEFVDWTWLDSQAPVMEKKYVRHIRAERDLIIKINSKKGICVILKDGSGLTG